MILAVKMVLAPKWNNAKWDCLRVGGGSINCYVLLGNSGGLGGGDGGVPWLQASGEDGGRMVCLFDLFDQGQSLTLVNNIGGFWVGFGVGPAKGMG